MGKIAKQLAAVFFLNIWKVTGYKVKKITRFDEQHIINTIAIFSTTALGDFILNTPAMGAIKARWPHAKLLLVINQRNEALVAGSGLFDEIIFWNGKVNSVIRVAATLRRHKVDATFILHALHPMTSWLPQWHSRPISSKMFTSMIITAERILHWLAFCPHTMTIVSKVASTLLSRKPVCLI
ncbi:glycosyltransferase family 9 protein [Izhakiella capsodis]|uniref:glycosyltransferase family 9 protein n=1 Tax=Izhakiella capsodis TaxID=1367852 RepID=UPI000A971F37|nr:hypothetical protein [Izhakiella capsodis]